MVFWSKWPNLMPTKLSHYIWYVKQFFKLLYCQSHSWRIPVQLAVVIYTLNCSSLVAHQACVLVTM